jgi:protein-disulfide isomerase
MRPFYIALAVIAILGTGALLWVSQQNRGPQTVAIDPNAPPPQAEGYLLGSASAPVEIIEFADFECPACGRFATITEPDVRKRLIETGQASLRFYDFPLPMHRNTWQASMAAACASDQGKFWEMHDRIFAGQFDWNGEATRNPKGIFEGYARTIGLDVDVWEQCYDSQKHLSRIQGNKAEAERRGVNQTPTFIIGNKAYAGALNFDELRAIVDSVRTAAGTTGAAGSAASAGNRPAR